jgi:hypothetical protein
MIQSIIFNKDLWTPQRAVKWLMDNHHKVLKIDETKHYYRFRQTQPKKGDTYYTKDIGKGIKLIIENPKPPQTQRLYFK